MQPLIDLTGEEVEGLISQVRGWESGMKRYKGWDLWGEVVESWCESKLAQPRREEAIVEDSILREKKRSI